MAQNSIQVKPEDSRHANTSVAAVSEPLGGDSGGTSDPSTNLSGPSTNTKEVAKKPSRSSLIGKKRNGSVASSQHSHGLQSGSLAAVGQSAVPGSPTIRPEKKKKSGGASRFLSFLSCCGGAHDSGDIDMDEHTLPARRPSKLQAERPAQTKTQDISGAESSTADESKDISVEKIGGPPYSDLKSAGEPKVQEPSKTATPPKASPSQSGGNDMKVSSEGVPIERTINPQAQSSAQIDNASSEAVTSIPVPASNNAIQEASANEGGVIDDRTTQQEKIDSDLDMPDAPALDAVDVDSSKSKEDSKSDSTPPLPPPPPVAPLRHDSTSSAQPERLSNNLANVQSERQKWLLPPIRPEFRGKKCLVLDLDETLVHSSFKVSYG